MSLKLPRLICRIFMNREAGLGLLLYVYNTELARVEDLVL